MGLLQNVIILQQTLCGLLHILHLKLLGFLIQILDFSDKLSTPSFADEDSQKLLEELLKGENE